LNKPDAPTQLIDEIKQSTGRLDVLINNASDFFATPLGSVTQSDWDSLINSNLRGPFFLSQAAAPLLRSSRGLILNILDIHASKPLRDHSVYCMAKAGLSMMTRALAQDLAPEIRVNGIAPGAIVWPEQNISEQERQRIVSQTPMGRTGDVADISGLAVFLATDAEFITGQVIAVDGGRSVSD
jgi:pteridine reductase